MILITRKFIRLFLLAIAALYFANGANAADNINLSTKPLHSLAASIMEGVSTPTLILENRKSLHHISMAPSTIRKLQSANVVIWMGPNVEPFLQNALKAVPSETTIHDLGNITENEIHWWTDPAQAMALVGPISTIIIENDPQNRAVYQANAEALTKRLENLISEISNAVAQFQNTRFLTLHEVYRKFNERFKLLGGEAIERNGIIGAKSIARLRGELLHSNIHCVFGETGENTAILNTLLEGTDAKSATLDALGTNLAAGPQFYETLIRQIAKTYEVCFNTN